LQALDAVLGEGGDAVFIDTPDVEAAVLGVHGDRQLVEPLLVLAQHFGDAGDGEDGGDSSHRQAARLMDAAAGRQFHGRSSSSLWTGCSAMRASTSASQACGLMSHILAVTMRLYMAAAR